jgi:hypothetical protein
MNSRIVSISQYRKDDKTMEPKRTGVWKYHKGHPHVEPDVLDLFASHAMAAFIDVCAESEVPLRAFDMAEQMVRERERRRGNCEERP